MSKRAPTTVEVAEFLFGGPSKVTVTLQPRLRGYIDHLIALGFFSDDHAAVLQSLAWRAIIDLLAAGVIKQQPSWCANSGKPRQRQPKKAAR